MLRRILVMGAAGSGKSTLGAALAKVLGYRYADTDDMCWAPSDPPFTKKRDREEQLRLLKATLNGNECCIVSGSFSGWGDRISADYDAVIWLVTSVGVRLERLRAREAQRYGEAILPGGKQHGAHEAFMTWAASYETRTEEGRCLSRDMAWFDAQRCPALRLDGALSLDDQLAIVLNWLQPLER
jgi:adenylate kinase family enzyme